MARKHWALLFDRFGILVATVAQSDVHASKTDTTHPSWTPRIRYPGGVATINVLRKVKLESGWRLLAVAKAGNTLDWAKVMAGGSPIVAASGTFYLEWREAGKRLRRAVGDHPRQAKEALASQAKIVSLREGGMDVDDAPQIAERRQLSGRSIKDAIDGFIEAAPLKYRRKSVAKYVNALRSFQRWTKKTHLVQLGREDVVEFMGHLVKAESLDRSTAVDKGHVIHTVFKQAGAEIHMKRGDWPRITEQERDVYEVAQLEKLFAACTESEFALFQTFLLSGLREQEVGFLAWEDFNPRRGTLAVRQKAALGFAPKNYQERTVPVPASLVQLLQAHRKSQADGEYFIFPTAKHMKKRGLPGGQRDRHMLDRLKRLAYRAGLNCGHCSGRRGGKVVTCAKSPACKRFGLHKFRHTYATILLHDGVDLVSLQKLLGHSDMESTRRYLKALQPEDLRAKIAASSLATRNYCRMP